MICIVNEQNKITNIVNRSYPLNADERQWYPWNYIGSTYTDVEPPEYTYQREAADRKNKLQQKALESMMLVLNGSSEISVLQKEYQAELNSVTDDIALYMVEMYPLWNSNGVQYKKNQRVSYDGILYKILQDHTSQETWKPNVSPSLFVKVISSINGEIPEWQQPSAENAYQKGDKVRYNGKVYESLIDNNVWSPDAYPAGWKDITDEIGEVS